MKYLATPQTVALRHKQYDFKYSCITLIAWNLFLVNFLTLCTYIYIYISSLTQVIHMRGFHVIY